MSISTILSIRKATLDDIDELVRLRLAFQRETRYVESEEVLLKVGEATQAYFCENIASGKFHAWIAEFENEIIATSGLIFFEKPPAIENLSGLEAFILNMYTLPSWRGRGLATRLMQEILAFVRTTEAGRVWLYATEAGKPVYEKAGFVVKHRHTDEMELHL